MINIKLERKQLQFKLDAGNDEEASQGIFSGYAAVFGNVDSGGDVIEQGAFEKCLGEGTDRIKILALHNDAWLPIGKPIELKEDETGLYIKAKISDTSLGRDIKRLLEDGVLTEMSIGYDPEEYYLDENGIRHLQEVTLYEVSLVTWAMNEKAVVTDYKSAGTREGPIAAANAALKSGKPLTTEQRKALREKRIALKSASDELDALLRADEKVRLKPYAKQLARKSAHQNKTIIITH